MGSAFRISPVTTGLIIVNILVFVWSAVQPGAFSSESLLHLGANYGLAIGVKGEWWRLLTSMFLHGGVTHILLNMVSLYIVGKIAENLLGSRDYLALYMASGIVGAATSAIIHPEGLSVGASGAIFGIFGAVAGYVIAYRDRLGDRFEPIIREFGGVLVFNLVFGFVVPGIDMSAHIGGLAVGLIGGLLARFPRMVMIWSLVISFAVLVYMVTGYPSVFAHKGAVY